MEAIAAACASATCTSVIKARRAMRRALQALGERASITEGVAIEGRSSGRPPRLVRVLTGSVVGLFYVSGTGGPIKNIVPSNSRIKTRISTEISCRIVVGGYSSEQSRHNAELQCAFVWARCGKNDASGRIAPSNSSSKTRSSTELPGI